MFVTRRPSSAYYPPRARWYSPVLSAFDQVRRIVALDRLNLSLGPGINSLELVAGFVVPGLAFYFRLPGIIGRAALGWAAFLCLMFFIFLGSAWDNLVFGLLLSAHVSGFVFYCTPMLGPSLWKRLLFTLAMLVAIRLLVYSPAQALVSNYVATPLQWQNQSVIVGPIYSTKSIQRGDTIAYNISGSTDYEEGEAFTRAGIGFAPVLALPGDRITFETSTYSVNGVAHQRLPFMPQTGKSVVPEKEWFVWPNVDIQERRYVGESRVPDYLMRMALVTESQLIGKPFQRWFWWKQKLS